MKRILRQISVSMLFALGVMTAVAQQGHFHCGTSEMHRRAKEKYPNIQIAEEQLEDFIRNYRADANTRDGQDTIIIPIVFHIIHDGGPENISDAQILDQVRILNEDYNKMNDDTTEVIPAFRDIIANVHIEFRLAQLDPYGNCTNGIERIRSLETYAADDGSKLHPWLRDRYLNVWVVNSIGEAGVAGYAYYPSAVIDSPMTGADGILILHNYIGSIGTSAPNYSRALTHEIGHYLNLAHPWGSTNDPGVECGDDFVEDTPITKGWDFCPSANASRVCNDTIFENYQNFMDYSYCSVMFTEGQKERMLAALASSASSRNFLYSPTALHFTGVDSIPARTCAPKADFYPNRPYVCIGDNVTMRDNTGNGTPTSWMWTFQDGNPSTSNSQNPTVSFTSGGWKSITLTVMNDQGTDTKTITKCVYVSADWSDLSGPIHEDFNTAPNMDSFWLVNNPNQNSTFWKYSNTVGYSGNTCVVLNAVETPTTALNDGSGDVDELITPSMDLSGLSGNGNTFTFKYAYATRGQLAADITEKLEVYSSKDCGKTWSLRYTLDGLDLSASGSAAGYFVPTLANWNDGSFNIPTNLLTGEVRFKFVFTTSSVSNNVYIDDININGTVSVESLVNDYALNVIPNPANENSYISLSTSNDEAMTIRILDITGKEIALVNSTRLKRGTYTFPLGQYNLSAGLYFVTAQSATKKQTLKFIVK